MLRCLLLTILAAFCLRFTPESFAQTIFINEFHAENPGPILGSHGQVTGVNDVNGNSSDWIEIRNSGPSLVNLNGWALSDDAANPGKWVFPSTSLPAGGYLLVFASGKDRAVSGVQLHTNFKLDGSGVVLLSQPDGGGGWNVIHQIGTPLAPYPKQRYSFSYGYAGNLPSGSLGFLEFQTPGSGNIPPVVSSFVQDTSFSIDRGFFDTPQAVTITSPTPGATLWYTTNGSEPVSGNPAMTTVPPPDGATPPSTIVNVTTTTCIRARAIKAGMGSTNVDTQTYIFPAAVLAQNGPPLPSLSWGNPGPDWEMDLEVVEHPDPESRALADDLKSIPTVSVVLNWNDLFGGSTAIYPPAPGVALDSVERLASLEFFNPDGSKTTPNAKKGKQQTGTIEITGGTSVNRWNSHKLSMKFNFAPDMEFNLFGDDGAKRFDQVILDARYNNVWTYGGGSGPEAQRLRSDLWGDAFVAEMQILTGGIAPRSQAVHLYLNGMYWGIYVLHERPEDNFAATYMGGDSEDWDVLKHNKSAANLVAGRVINPAQPVSPANHTAGVNYQAMLSMVEADLSVDANYQAAVAKIDVDHLINYMLLNFYFGNTDWSHQNWYASYRRNASQPLWRWHSWDAEHIMESVTANETGDGTAANVQSSGGPGYVHERLSLNPEYRMRFADLAHRHLFNNGLLTYPRVWQLFDGRMQVFSEALRAESARWGDNRAHLRPSPFTNVPYRRGVEWFNQRTWWQNTYFPTRSSRTLSAGNGGVLMQLSGRNLYPAGTPAPVFNQHGGDVPANFSLTISNPAGSASLIRYTLDGSDPRLPGGAVSPSAITYGGAVTLTSSRPVKARVLSGGVWSALNEAYFSVDTVPAAAGNLVISKIHYRPAALTPAEIGAGFSERSDFEFLEVLNVSANRVNIEGLSFSAGLDIAPISNGIRELEPGGRALYVAKPSAFAFRYGSGHPVAGEFILGSNLSNDGETLTLHAANGSIIVSITYNDVAPWPVAPDGSGPSLVLMHPGVSDPAAGSNWRQSTANDGAPGVDDRLYFSAWQTAQFPGGGPNAALLADPDADGLPNLAEFGLGTDPNGFTPANLAPFASTQVLDAGAGPKPYLTFTVRRLKAAEELTWTAEGATALPNWSTDPGTIVPLTTPADNGDGTETRIYRAAQPIEAGGALFFRARVTAP